MEISSTENLPMLAYEAFVRRAAQIDLPFMLKGSYVTRQYFDNPGDRVPNDLDWVYLGDAEDAEDARKAFDYWATRVTEAEADDGVMFRSFRENAFWRMIDYAMADDFPTVNTDLRCTVDGEPVDSFTLDLSFNLDVDQPPVPLFYQPLCGEPFVVPKTVPLSTQAAWKIHQTLVRPRFKDVFDLTHLLRHADFDETACRQAVQTLINECSADNVDLNRLKWLIDGDFARLFPARTLPFAWSCWRYDADYANYPGMTYERARTVTNLDNIPAELPDFINEFTESLNNSGINQTVFENLPAPQRRRRKTFEKPVADDETAPSATFWDNFGKWFKS